jgi:hypothetical protein
MYKRLVLIRVDDLWFYRAARSKYRWSGIGRGVTTKNQTEMTFFKFDSVSFFASTKFNVRYCNLFLSYTKPK